MNVCKLLRVEPHWSKRKIHLTSVGIETATFGVIVQCSKQLTTELRGQEPPSQSVACFRVVPRGQLTYICNFNEYDPQQDMTSTKLRNLTLASSRRLALLSTKPTSN